MFRFVYFIAFSVDRAETKHRMENMTTTNAIKGRNMMEVICECLQCDGSGKLWSEYRRDTCECYQCGGSGESPVVVESFAWDESWYEADDGIVNWASWSHNLRLEYHVASGMLVVMDERVDDAPIERFEVRCCNAAAERVDEILEERVRDDYYHNIYRP